MSKAARDETNRRGAAPGTGRPVDRASDRSTEWEHKRRQILDGAAQVFSRQGFQKGTTKEIAAEVGLSQPSIYHYVGSKSDLLREIALQVDRDMLAALDRALGTSDEPAEQLRAVIFEFTRAVVDNRYTFAVYRREGGELEPEVATKVEADERSFIAAVERIVIAVQRDGVLPPGPPAVVTQGILNMVSELYRWYRSDGALDAGGVAQTFCDLIGLGPRRHQ